MKSHIFAFLFICALTLVVGCGDAANEPTANKGQATTADPNEIIIGSFPQKMLENGEPSHITVQHLLIAFEGSVPGKSVTRTREEAETLAKKLFEEAKSGGDFDLMIEKNTDDSPPGIYHMANFGQQADMNNPIPSRMVFARGNMVGAFGNVGFPLKVGEFGLATYDPEESKYGWHIIKRLQ